MPWMLNEDNALKQQLSGITVSDEKNSNRPVGVWFGSPEPEIRDRMIPFISIDCLAVEPELERNVGGPYKHDWGYIPDDGVTTLTLADTLADQPSEQLVATIPPRPFTFTYQVTTWARHPRHDRQLLAALLGNKLPFQFGMVLVYEDQTVRRLDVESMNKSDILDGDRKQIFRNVFTVKMSSELFFFQLQAIPTVWSSVVISGDPLNTSTTPVNEVITFPTPTS